MRKQSITTLILVSIGLVTALGVGKTHGVQLPQEEFSIDPTAGEFQIVTFPHKGHARRFGIHVPNPLERSQRRPLLVIHGIGLDMAQFGLQLFGRYSDAHRMIVIFPQPADGHMWLNDGIAPQSETDDVGFTCALIEHLAKGVYNIDVERVYLFGVSNGGNLVSRICCERPELVAAATAVLSTIHRDWMERYVKRPPVPIMLMNGDRDPIFPWEGGAVGLLEDKEKWGPIVSGAEYVEFWTKRNRSATEPIIRDFEDLDPNDGSRTARWFTIRRPRTSSAAWRTPSGPLAGFPRRS